MIREATPRPRRARSPATGDLCADDPSNGLAAHLAVCDQVPLLSAEAEQTLAQQARSGDGTARDHLIRANLRLVVYIARRYQGRGLSLDDLVGYGHVGLVHAADLFDPAFGNRFTSYAGLWINQAISYALVCSGYPVRIPANLQTTAGQSRDSVGTRAVARLSRATVDTDQSQLNNLPDSAPPVGAELEAREEHALRATLIVELLKNLSACEQMVIAGRYGLNGPPQTQPQIAQRLGVTKQRVMQIEKQAIAHLRSLAQAGQIDAEVLNDLGIVCGGGRAAP